MITGVLKDFPNVIVLADEVYHFLTYDDNKHVCFAEIGDNYNRTITVHSGGKFFYATGWKIGWAVGPPELTRQCAVVAMPIMDCVNGPA